METGNPPLTPPALPGYEMIRLLGSGGTSIVWLARQLSLDRVVAIKILSPTLLADETACAQFQKEARAAARLSHAAIVRILDFGEHAGMLYYVMEYVDGTSLAGWLAEHKRMAHGEALKLAEIIASALDTVWREAHLIHCDIKPGNILLGKDGSVKITDLGLARIAGVAATREPSVSIEGTPTYLAPEQIEGLEPDCRSDIYSLGLTLYHVLTGHPPFEGRSLEEILEAQQSDFLRDPCEILPRLPVSYGWLLAKMTAKDPAKRHASWNDVLKDIHQIKSGRSPLPPYPGEDESTILLNPRHRPSARANTLNLSAAARKAITLTASESLVPRQKRSPAKAVAHAGGTLLRFLLFLAFTGGILYLIWLLGFKDHPERVEQVKAAFRGERILPPSEKPSAPVGGTVRNVGETPPAPPAPPREPLPSSPAAPASPPVEESPPISVTTGTVTPGAWNHPGFIQAANLFNQTLTTYQKLIQKPDPQDPAWAGLLADAQYAALLFETIKPSAPTNVPILLYANQCYQLVNDIRRARLTREAKKNLHALAPKRRHPQLAPYPTPPVDPQDPFAPRYMQFGYAWDTLPAPVDRPETPEFVFLLSTVAEPSADTRSQPGLRIHGPLAWMMPVTEAAKLIGQSLSAPRVPIEGAPFPYGGFFQHTLPSGRFGTIGPGQPSYPTIRLITDSEDRLVAIQLIDEQPPPPLAKCSAGLLPLHQSHGLCHRPDRPGKRRLAGHPPHPTRRGNLAH